MQVSDIMYCSYLTVINSSYRSADHPAPAWLQPHYSIIYTPRLHLSSPRGSTTGFCAEKSLTGYFIVIMANPMQADQRDIKLPARPIVYYTE